MLSDGEARIRRRAALAIGHVGIAEGVDPLVALLADRDPEVRQMAAFALGLIGDARAREARIHAARIWDEKALSVVEQALDLFELQRAKELAHHYRWRASKTAPKDYGDKVTQEHTGADGGPIQARIAVEFVKPAPRAEDD